MVLSCQVFHLLMCKKAFLLGIRVFFKTLKHFVSLKSLSAVLIFLHGCSWQSLLRSSKKKVLFCKWIVCGLHFYFLLLSTCPCWWDIGLNASVAIGCTVSNNSSKELLHAPPQWCSSPKWLHHCNRFASRVCLSNMGYWSAKKTFSGTFVKMLMHILFCNFQMTIMITMENQRTLACQRVDSNSAFSTQLQGQQVFTVFVFLGLWSCAYYVSFDSL
jgi:hypothetical protein